MTRSGADGIGSSSPPLPRRRSKRGRNPSWPAPATTFTSRG
jgi:hypothetical protein